MKLQKISEIQPTLPLTEFDFMQKYRENFRQSELGHIYSLLPLTELATAIAEKMPAKKPQGNKPMFPLEGKIALMFHKPYAGLSDDGLIEMLFGKWKGEMANLDRCLSDAMCYESHPRFPTDAKLLWEACDWLHSLMKKSCKEIGERMPRNKFNDVDKARLVYAKQRKPKKNSFLLNP